MERMPNRWYAGPAVLAPNGAIVNSQGWSECGTAGSMLPIDRAPTGRPNSVPDVPLVPRQPMLGQQAAKFIRKAQRLMMPFLVGDVSLHGIEVRRRDGERPVPGLPRESALVWKLLVNPLRRTGLDVA